MGQHVLCAAVLCQIGTVASSDAHQRKIPSLDTTRRSSYQGMTFNRADRRVSKAGTAYEMADAQESLKLLSREIVFFLLPASYCATRVA